MNNYDQRPVNEIIPPTPTDLDWAAKLEAAIQALPETSPEDNR